MKLTPLPRGTRYSNNVIVGKGATPHPFGHPDVSPGSPASITEVARALRDHHHLYVGADMAHVHTSSLAAGQQSQIRYPTLIGDVIRVIKGNGALWVGAERYPMGFGWWAFIPLTHPYRMAAAARGSENFIFTSGCVARMP